MGNIARARIANRAHAALFLRIHADGAADRRAAGTHTLYPALHAGWTDDVYAASKRAAGIVQRELVRALGFPDRGLQERSDFTGFNWSNVPVILVEMGFMTNPDRGSAARDRRLQAAGGRRSLPGHAAVSRPLSVRLRVGVWPPTRGRKQRPQAGAARSAGRSRTAPGRAGRRARAGPRRRDRCRRACRRHERHGDRGGGADAPPLVRHRVDALRPPRHPDEHHGVRDDRRDGGAHHPVGRDQRQAEADVDCACDPRHDPVELRPARPADADRDDDVAGERDGRERERADDARRAREVRLGQPVARATARAGRALSRPSSRSRTRYVSTKP